MWIIKEDNLINLDSLKRISIDRVDGTIDYYQLIGYFIDSGYIELSDAANYKVIEYILKDIRKKIINEEPYMDLLSINEAERRIGILEDIKNDF